jgi:hypothetical protein
MSVPVGGSDAETTEAPQFPGPGTRAGEIVYIDAPFTLGADNSFQYEDKTIWVNGSLIELWDHSILDFINCSLYFNCSAIECPTIRLHDNSTFSFIRSELIPGDNPFEINAWGSSLSHPSLYINDSLLVNLGSYGIYADFAKVALNNITLVNQSTIGSQIYLVDSIGDIINTEFQGGEIAIDAYYSDVRIENCVFNNLNYGTKTSSECQVNINNCHFGTNTYYMRADGTVSSYPRVFLNDCTFDYFDSASFLTFGYHDIRVRQRPTVHVYNASVPVPGVKVEFPGVGGTPYLSAKTNADGEAYFDYLLLGMQIVDTDINFLTYFIYVTKDGKTLEGEDYWPIGNGGHIYFSNYHPFFYEWEMPYTTLDPGKSWDNTVSLTNIINDDFDTIQTLDITIYSNSAKGIVELNIRKSGNYAELVATWDPWFQELDKAWAGQVSFRLKSVDNWGLSSVSEPMMFWTTQSITSSPVIDPLPVIEVIEDTPKDNALDLRKYIHDSDDDFEDLNIYVYHPHPAVVLDVDDEGFLDITYLADNFTGEYVYQIYAEDTYNSGGAYGTVRVHNVNDPPVPTEDFISGGTYQIEEDVEQQYNIPDMFYDSDSIMEFSISYNANITLELKDNPKYGQNITITPAPDYHGQEEISIYALDGYSKAEVKVTVKVVPTNDPPIIRCQSYFQVVTGERLEFYVNGYDPDGPQEKLTYRSTITDPYGNPYDEDRVLYLDRVTGKFTWVPQEDEEGTHHIEFTVSDGPESVNLTVTIEVLVDNHLPRARIDSPNTYIQSYNTEEPILFDASNSSDQDLNDSSLLQYRWISDIQGELGYGQRFFIYLIEGQHQITLELSDGKEGVVAWTEIYVDGVGIIPPDDDNVTPQENRTWNIPEYKQSKEDNTMGYVLLVILGLLLAVVIGYVFIFHNRTPLAQLQYLMKSDRAALGQAYRDRERRRQERHLAEEEEENY